MSEEDRFWHHAGISDIRDKKGSFAVRIPDRLFRDNDILTLGVPVFWSIHAVIGTVIISDHRLEGDEYEFVKYTKFREGDSEFECTIPKEFFTDFEGRGGPAIQPIIADRVNLELDERLHFMWHDGMEESPTKSCYVFTEAQFLDRFEESDLWDESLSEVPQFIS